VWTSGGGIIHNGIRLSRDLFSKKLKVIIEYDGVWHFKDIHGQLKDKQVKDKALEDWVIENNWRLIRIKEDIYKSNKQLWIKELVKCVYSDDRQIIKLY
jgi:very-short-patch-repair endonuclease